MPELAVQPVDLRDRTLNFSRDILRFYRSIRRDIYSEPIIKQMIRSATSVGANFVEAKDSASKKDFRNKVLISKKEASETLYWLKLAEDLAKKDEAQALQEECKQIILILQKIIYTLDH